VWTAGITRRRLTVIAFLAPWIVGFCAFVAYPMLASLYFSFTDYNMSNTNNWVGLRNYRIAFTADSSFWVAVRNTLWIICIAVPAKILFGLGIGQLLIGVRRGGGAYRTILYLPAMVPLVAASMSFIYVLSGKGPVNQLLGAIGLPQPLWFTDPSWAKPGLGLLMVWAVGNTMVLLLTALLDVPTQLYEAAKIDGADALGKFIHVTLPMISPVLLFCLITGIIDGFQYFTQAYVVAKSISTDGVLGAPANSTMFYGTRLYQQAYVYFHVGYASALAWLLVIVLFIVTAVFIRTSRRWVYYSEGS
jgi:multiple sugar transport system permease protein